MPTASEVWLPIVRPATDCRLRLFCFPYAGGSASVFARWGDPLPRDIEVRALQLPGHGRRIQEPLLHRWTEVVSRITAAMAPLLDRPFAVFGHSLGALLGFETIRHLRRHGWSLPVHFFASGRRAPHLRPPDLSWIEGSPDAFVDRLKLLRGMSPEILDDPELMELLVPVLRADFEVCRGYEYLSERALSCPISAMGGTDDPESCPAFLEGWRVHTVAECAISRLAGSHFYIQESHTAVVTAVAAALEVSALASQIGVRGRRE